MNRQTNRQTDNISGTLSSGSQVRDRQHIGIPEERNQTHIPYHSFLRKGASQYNPAARTSDSQAARRRGEVGSRMCGWLYLH